MPLVADGQGAHDDPVAVVVGRELLEREAVLDQLRAAFDSAAAGSGQLVFVGGEAGVGKTAVRSD
jgi:hypothetical protein